MKDTFIPSKLDLKQQWYIIDAKDKCLGRLATEVSNLLRGKNKTIFTPAQDVGDYIIIVNASEINVTGKKRVQKLYFRHSGRPGGKTVESFEDLQVRIPERILEKAIKGMLPKNRLGRKLFTKLKVYKGQEHPHMSQKPQKIEL
uniref:Large ribosomal subunit protein uL13c n=4 Tax=Laminariales TaxID=2886 RepID=A0A8K1M2L7_9PHAE|nr:50S ribosomal protein L13 [Saccharina latissima]YP_010206551.1 ribosomal protein L13 [Alaria crispa]YP_010206692.1 ribosomal protein L13 [Alaria marginata]YP_010206833.1 ribosomal protein L13 [Alaria esculenta]YP_010206974.1 ribosomal protein L13 [Alaria crassifolia]YP_010207115.1 ribosomal protein L13 [Alaria praelonga]YP_010688174.1 50S ribosomal protein L13 [Saccharina longissima]UAX21994.1 ribosomal protein L13 [Alaria sp. PI001]UAX22135.1 ribosomal protein L13 [Alaria sp. PI20]UAX2